MAGTWAKGGSVGSQLSTSSPSPPPGLTGGKGKSVAAASVGGGSTWVSGRRSSRGPCCVLPLWALLALGVGSLSTLSALSVFGIMYSAQSNQRSSYNSLLAGVALAGMREAAGALSTGLADAAGMVRYSVPAAANCSLPSGGLDPTPMARLFNSIAMAAPEKNLNSVGIIQALSQYNTSNARASTGKINWQIAKFYMCPDYVYAWCDNVRI